MKLALGCALLVGCWSGARVAPPPPVVLGQPIVPPRESPVHAHRPGRHLPARSLWIGTYVPCGGSVLDASLAIDVAANGAATAVFAVFTDPNKVGVPTSTSEFTGTIADNIDGTFTLEFETYAPVVQTPGAFVALSATVDRRVRAMHGAMRTSTASSSNCSRLDFEWAR